MNIAQMATEYWPYVYPFLTAGVGAYAGYRLGIRARRQDQLTSERITAFKRIMIKLASIQRFCEARPENNPSEFAARLSDLPIEDQKSPLEHWQELEIIVDEVSCFMPSRSVEVLEELKAQLSMLSSVELAAAVNPHLARSLLSPREAYLSAAQEISRSRQILRSHLGLPNGG